MNNRIRTLYFDDFMDAGEEYHDVSSIEGASLYTGSFVDVGMPGIGLPQDTSSSGSDSMGNILGIVPYKSAPEFVPRVSPRAPLATTETLQIVGITPSTETVVDPKVLRVEKKAFCPGWVTRAPWWIKTIVVASSFFVVSALVAVFVSIAQQKDDTSRGNSAATVTALDEDGGFDVVAPTLVPTLTPTGGPTRAPFTVSFLREISAAPSVSATPSIRPSIPPTKVPTSSQPTGFPSSIPSDVPSIRPTFPPSPSPSQRPSRNPTGFPSAEPSDRPNPSPSKAPSVLPSSEPSRVPSLSPSSRPSVDAPSSPPSRTAYPSWSPTMKPTRSPTQEPTKAMMNMNRRNAEIRRRPLVL